MQVLPHWSSIFGGGPGNVAKSLAGDEEYGLDVFKRWDTTIGDRESVFSTERAGQVQVKDARCGGIH